MKYADLKKSLQSASEASVYLLEGDDVFFRENGLTQLIDKYVSEPSLDFTAMNGDVNPSELAVALSSYPFMSKKRLVAVREFYPKAEMLKGELGKFFSVADSHSVLVVLNAKPCEILKKQPSVTVIDCDRADVNSLGRWISVQAAQNGANITSANAVKLAEYSNRDMTKIVNELNKLIDYCCDKGEIESEDIEKLAVKDVEYRIYEMTDFIAKKQCDKAIAVIEDMMGKGDAPQFLTVSIYNYFRRMLHTAISDKSDAELAVLFGVKEYAVKKTREQAKMFKVKALKKTVDALADSDYRCKSGKIGFDGALWTSLFRIITE